MTPSWLWRNLTASFAHEVNREATSFEDVKETLIHDDCQNVSCRRRAGAIAPSPGNTRGDLPEVRRRHDPCVSRWGDFRRCPGSLAGPRRNTLPGRYAVPADPAPPTPVQRQVRCTRLARGPRHHPDVDLPHRRAWQSDRRPTARLQTDQQ